MTPGRSGGHAALAVAAAGLAIALLLMAQAPAARAEYGWTGIDVLMVNGTFEGNATLPGGSYYLASAAYDASSYVNATLSYNGTVYAQDNRTGAASTPVSLPAGNYSIALSGHGSAALGWDFTNGTTTDFPANQILVAFLTPTGPRVHVEVTQGDALYVFLHVYDADLIPAGNATLDASGSVDFVLPASRTAFALLVAAATQAPPGGLFGLAWTSGPVNPPVDLTAWPWFLLWILVPMAVAAAVLVVLHHRRGRSGRAP